VTDETSSPFAAVIGLGPLKSDHTPTLKTRRSRIIWNVGAIGLGGFLVLAALAWMVWSSTQRASSDNGFPFVLLCCGCVAAPLGVFGLFNTWRNWSLGAALYENGFAYQDRRGLRQVSWSDIDAVWQNITRHYRNGAYTGTTYVYTVQTKDGQRLVLNGDLPGIQALGEAVVRGSTVTLFPRYVQELQAGRRVAFGPLALDPQGLYHGTKTLPWSQAKAVRIHQGIISVKKEGGWLNWASVSMPQIPNFFIFYELIQRFAPIEKG
jgi:hypothetical protein